jgi:hypothetical protein
LWIWVKTILKRVVVLVSGYEMGRKLVQRKKVAGHHISKKRRTLQAAQGKDMVGP